MVAVLVCFCASLGLKSSSPIRVGKLIEKIDGSTIGSLIEVVGLMAVNHTQVHGCLGEFSTVLFSNVIWLPGEVTATSQGFFKGILTS